MIYVYKNDMVKIIPSYNKGNPMFDHMPDIVKWINVVRVFDQTPDEKLYFGAWYNPHSDKGCIIGWCARDSFFLQKGLRIDGLTLVYKKRYWIRKYKNHEAVKAFFKNKGDKENIHTTYFQKIFYPIRKESSREHIKKAIADYVERTCGYILFPPPQDLLHYW